MHIPQRILTPRLVLRRHRRADLESFTEFMCDPGQTRFLGFAPNQKTPEGARGLLMRIIGSYQSTRPILALGVELRATGVYVGNCGLAPLREAGGVEVFYNILPAFQGQGLATEAARAMLGHAFDHPEVEMAAAFIWPENTASIRVAQKAGMTLAGLVDHPDFPDKVERWERGREE